MNTKNEWSLTIVVLCVLLSAGVPRAMAAADYVWWEAENPKATNCDQITDEGDAGREALSGGKWIGSEIKPGDAPRFLEYEVTIPSDGNYEFFARKFWQHGPFRWRFDDRPWQEMTHEGMTLLDNVVLRKFWCVNWVPVGHVDLTKGTHSLRIESTAKEGAFFFDCFLLTRKPFTPRGKIRPDDLAPPPPSGWFNFLPQGDDSAKSLIDLRELNEKNAGDGGYITAKGEHFVHGKTGEIVRFWGVDAGPSVIRMPHDYVDRLAAFLAKKGVNLVRAHGRIVIGNGPRALECDKDYLDQLYYFQNAMKKQGIYTHLSIYFPLWLRLGKTTNPAFKSYTEIPYFGDNPPFAIHFFNPAFQAVMKGWWKELLTTKNPYSGMTLADDPAVFGTEMLNEDSLFFYTFHNGTFPKDQRQMFERQFHEWLIGKYGSLDKARAAWGGETNKNDADAVEGVAAIIDLRPPGNKPATQRQIDTLEFQAGTQMRFFTVMRDYLKKELGFKGVIDSSNWITCDPKHLTPVEKWTNLQTDFMDYHAYFGVPRQSVVSGGVGPGEIYADRSMLRMDPGKGDGKKSFFAPASFTPPFVDMVYSGQPSMVSEYAYLGFNRFRGEMPLVNAALFAQSGIDAPVCFIVQAVPGWSSAETGLYEINTPSDIGQYPAAALIFRKGLVRETDPVVHAILNQNDMMHLKGTPLVTGNNDDDNRKELKNLPGHDDTLINPKMFALGKIKLDIVADQPTSLKSVKLADYENKTTKTLTSLTGETVWDYGRALYQIRTPQAQAAVGFLDKCGPIDLGDIVIESGNEFASIALVAMDGKPIATSRKMLLQVFTEKQNAQYKTEPATVPGGEGAKKIVSIGEWPIQIRMLAGSIRFKRPDADALKIAACEPNGNAVGPASSPSGKSFALRPDILYYLITTP